MRADPALNAGSARVWVATSGVSFVCVHDNSEYLLLPLFLILGVSTAKSGRRLNFQCSDEKKKVLDPPSKPSVVIQIIV